MAGRPPVGGGRMDLAGGYHKDVALSGCKSCNAVLSYGRKALETLGGEPRGLSEPPEAIQRKTVQRPRRRAVLMSRVGITRRGRAEWSRMVPIGIANGSGSVRRDSSPRARSTQHQLTGHEAANEACQNAFRMT